MALTIQPKEFENKFVEEKADTHYLAIGSMAIGVPEITKQNCKEVYARHKFLNPNFPYSLEDVEKHIGMKTNVVPETKVRWLTRIAKNHFSDILWGMEKL
mgnify:FL=1